MTVCIAATCAAGQSVIIAADRMLSTSLVEFEHQSTKKIRQLSPRCHALTAGDALAHSELFTAVEAKICHLRDPSVETIVETIKETYQGIRQKKITEKHLLPRSFGSIAQFYQSQRHLAENLVYGIQNEIDRYDYGLAILVGGLSVSRAHIYSIQNPGISDCYDSINFHVIGSGAFHAFSSLIASGCHQMRTVEEALMSVLAAKRVAEVAPGVGTKTDISIILPNGTLEIPSERVGDLLPINDRWNKLDSSWEAECHSFLESLIRKPHPPQKSPQSSTEPRDDSPASTAIADNNANAAQPN